jgi:hypothetical protein
MIFAFQRAPWLFSLCSKAIGHFHDEEDEIAKEEPANMSIPGHPGNLKGSIEHLQSEKPDS